eukprot:1352698-Prymnesium_polylepis.1
MEEAAAADYVQADFGPGDGAAAAQPAARDAVDVSASPRAALLPRVEVNRGRRARVLQLPPPR